MLATLGLHLLLAWSWRSALPPAADLRAERVFDVIPLPPPAPRLPKQRTEPPRVTPARERAASTPADINQAAEPITPPVQAPPSVADPFAVPAPVAPAESPLDAVVARARRDTGVIDREQRKGKSGVPSVADTPWQRFTDGVGAAYNDRSRTLTSDTYTSPDGEVIYRFRQGGKVWCRISGGVKPGIGGAVGGGATAFDVQGGNGTAGLISCPRHGEWKRD